MDTVFDFNGPAALEFRVKHYQDQLRAQAARIIELEAKVAYLEKCLREVNARTANATSISSVKPSANVIAPSASLRQAAEESWEGNGPSSMSNDEHPILKPVARVPNTRGARNAPPHIVDADDSDNDDDTPPSPSCSTQPTKSPLPRSTSRPPKRNTLETESVPSSEPKLGTTADAPRKKPKLIVEVVITSRPRPPHSSKVPRLSRKPSDIDVSEHYASDRGSPEVRDADTRPVTPTSPNRSIAAFSSPSPSSSTSSVYEHPPDPFRSGEGRSTSPELVPAPATAQTDVRAQSEELSYLDDTPEPPSPVVNEDGPQIPTENHGTAAVQGHAASSVARVPVQSIPASPPVIIPGPAPRELPRVQDRLVGIPRFTVPIPNMPVERLLISRNRKDNLSFLSVPLRNLLASRNYILPKLALNPHLPPEPGSPGLLYLADYRTQWEPGDQTVFVWLDYGLLRYVGEYSLELDGPMSEQEYQLWPPELKKTWANSILTMSNLRAIRTRILLSQQLGRRPLGKEVMKAVRWRRFDNLEGEAKSNARAAIINAYERGDEHMIVWRLRCVGFDEELVQQMADMKNRAAQGNIQADDTIANTTST